LLGSDERALRGSPSAGVDLRGAKNAALRELVLRMTAPIVAGSFNYSYTVTEQHRRNAGAQFIDYLTKRPQLEGPSR